MGQAHRAIAAVLVGGLLMAPVGGVLGHGGATGVVKERMDAMERLDELMDRIFAMLHGELPYDAATVRKAATEIRDSSGTAMTRLFPEGSGGKPSEARAEIWTDFGTFTHLADRLGVMADLLAEQADNRGVGPTLPRKWEDVTMGPGMMRGQGRGKGMGPGMMGGGMMGGNMGAQMTAAHIAAMCNACHTRFREEN